MDSSPMNLVEPKEGRIRGEDPSVTRIRHRGQNMFNEVTGTNATAIEIVSKGVVGRRGSEHPEDGRGGLVGRKQLMGLVYNK